MTAITKATFNDFIQSPFCGKLKNNRDAKIIFTILSHDESIESMIASIANGEPALSPCVMAIESFIDNVPNTTMPIAININNNRQSIGRMVKTILAPYGYKPIPNVQGLAKTKPLPVESQARYFKEAAVYEKI
jgi:hypothetical protein